MLDLKGVWLCLRAEINQMLTQRGGVIVNTASIAGLVGLPNATAYVAAKHGVVGLTKTAALEYAEANIRVNAVCPGYIKTPMTAGMTPERGAAVLAQTPMKRLGEGTRSPRWWCGFRPTAPATSLAPATVSMAAGWRSDAAHTLSWYGRNVETWVACRLDPDPTRLRSTAARPRLFSTIAAGPVANWSDVDRLALRNQVHRFMPRQGWPVATPFEDFQSWFSNIIRSLYDNRDAGFVILLAAFPLLERYGRGKAGLTLKDDVGSSRAFFDELVRIFPELANRHEAKELWGVYRNGLLHTVTLSDETRKGMKLPICW